MNFLPGLRIRTRKSGRGANATAIIVKDENSRAEAHITFHPKASNWRMSGYTPVPGVPQRPFRIMVHNMQKRNSTERGIGRRMLCAALQEALNIKDITDTGLMDSRVVVEASGHVGRSYAALVQMYQSFGFRVRAIAGGQVADPDADAIIVENALRAAAAGGGGLTDEILRGIGSVVMDAKIRDVMAACDAFMDRDIEYIDLLKKIEARTIFPPDDDIDV